MACTNSKKLTLERLKSRGLLRTSYVIPELKTQPKPINVYNLSKSISAEELNFLKYGPNFIPSPSLPNLLKTVDSQLKNKKFFDEQAITNIKNFNNIVF